MELIIIAGMPATGKSTVAGEIGKALGMPILEKDDIKEEMFDTIGYTDLIQKRALDTAATNILLRNTEVLLKSGVSLILVNNFDSAMAPTVQSMIDRCGCRCVTVFLNGDPEVLYQRYVERDKKNSRHLGHTFIDRYPPQPSDPVGLPMTRQYFADRFEKQGMAEFQLAGKRINVDATYPETINVQALIQKIRAALEN